MSAYLNIRIRDTRMQNYLRSFPERHERVLAEWKETGSMMTMQQMRLEAPFRQGFLVESVDRRMTPKGFTVWPRASYAGFVEKGTRPHDIRPREAKALRWFGGYGEPIFARLVHHPGTEANPFTERTRDVMRAPLFDLAEELFRREFEL